MGTLYGQVDGRDPCARDGIATDGSATLIAPLEVFRLFRVAVNELATGRIAVIGGDDQAATGREPFNQRPECVPHQLLLHLSGEGLETLAGFVVVMEAMVRPVMPEDPVRFRADQGCAVTPSDVGGFGARARQPVGIPGAVVTQGGAL